MVEKADTKWLLFVFLKKAKQIENFKNLITLMITIIIIIATNFSTYYVPFTFEF